MKVVSGKRHLIRCGDNDARLPREYHAGFYAFDYPKELNLAYNSEWIAELKIDPYTALQHILALPCCL